MFPQTLLQRLDRVFARQCIEGRVPFLDQDLIAYAMRLPANKKILRTETTLVVKAPLRKLARALGVPQEIADREKMPMLHGSTTQANTEDESGFLEEYCKKKFRMSCSELVEKTYMELYGHTKTVDRLTGTDTFDMRAKELSLAHSLQKRRPANKAAL
jgi:asparagine synthetase B (glutamine-hydrolysing)